MEFDHETAATLVKLAFLAVLAYDVGLLLRPVPWQRGRGPALGSFADAVYNSGPTGETPDTPPAPEVSKESPAPFGPETHDTPEGLGPPWASWPFWQSRTRPGDELYRHGLNTYLFPLTVVMVLAIDLAAGLSTVVIALDLLLLLLVVIYLAWPRTVALLADGSLWLDGTRLEGGRLAGIETVEDHPRTLLVATDWHGLLVRKRLILAEVEDVDGLMARYREQQPAGKAGPKGSDFNEKG